MSSPAPQARPPLAWADHADFFTDGTASISIELERMDIAHLEAAIISTLRTDPGLELGEILARILRRGAIATLARTDPANQP